MLIWILLRMGRQVLELRDAVPVCRGNARNIYDLPIYPGSVLKTVRPDKVDENGFLAGKSAIKKVRLEGCYHGFARELREFLIQFRKHRCESAFSLPIAHIHGIVQTDEGAGLLVEKIVGTDGGLAPTIGRLQASGTLANKHRQALETMFERCRELHIVLNDIHANNIVYTEARNGMPECVCVDGYGERVLIPIQRWSKWVNRRRIDQIARDADQYLGGDTRCEPWGRQRRMRQATARA